MKIRNHMRGAMRQLSFIFILLLVLLAACSDPETPTPQAAQQPTQPLVVTRIVTLSPTHTPQPTPTLPYDLVPVAGRWIMSFDLLITGSDFADQVRYDGAADLLVSLDGSVKGNGYFSANLLDQVCNAQVLDSGTLTYTVTGRTFAEDDQIWVEVTLTPDTPQQRENYSVMCTEFADIKTIDEPVLWPILTTLERMSWRFALQGDQVFTFESNLALDLTSPLNGNLAATVRIDPA